jgi:hypothetical protein
MLKSDLVVRVVVGMLVSEAAKDDQLEGDEDDLQELDHQLPRCQATRDELLDRVHEEKRQIASQTFVVVDDDVDSGRRQ